MRDTALEFVAEFALELPLEDCLDLALLDTVLPLSRARLRRSSCMMRDLDLAAGRGERCE